MRPLIIFFALICIITINISEAKEDYTKELDKDFAILTDAQLRKLDNICTKARAYNEQGKITEGYKLFASLGDSYAAAASKIFDSSKVTMERCVIQSHWIRVVGFDTKDKLFDQYGKQYQSNYIELVCNVKKLPRTARIERLYGDTLKDMKLPDSLSIDKVLNRQPRGSAYRKFQNLFCNVMNGSLSLEKNGEWYDAISIDRGRVSDNQYKADISEKDADNLAIQTSLLTGPVCAALFGEKIVKSSLLFKTVDWAVHKERSLYKRAANMANKYLNLDFLHSLGSSPTKSCVMERATENFQ